MHKPGNTPGFGLCPGSGGGFIMHFTTESDFVREFDRIIRLVLLRLRGHIYRFLGLGTGARRYIASDDNPRDQPDIAEIMSCSQSVTMNNEN
jgi:hypothetical protein